VPVKFVPHDGEIIRAAAYPTGFLSACLSVTLQMKRS
jgi:hypothetical protein